jgi:hypothetical protein
LGVEDCVCSLSATRQKWKLVKASIVRFRMHQNRPYETKRTTGLVAEKIPITWPFDKVTIVTMALSRWAQCHDVNQPKFRDVNRN